MEELPCHLFLLTHQIVVSTIRLPLSFVVRMSLAFQHLYLAFVEYDVQQHIGKLYFYLNQHLPNLQMLV
ncbi:hypothetical protein SDC9_199388 [bioreactor metagenome]|uniref:Uncharacterized protein n=1 Tax=bioreactor metagenome TaxID=1076179 RepID=A0A645IMN5_9ZZZZ